MKRFSQQSMENNSLSGRRLVVLGYGAQGRAQASNLTDSGLDVVVALRQGSPRRQQVEADGLPCLEPAQAIAQADVVAMLLPDEAHDAAYQAFVAPHLRPGGAMVFAHGFSLHYQLFNPRNDLDLLLVAPKGVGTEVRRKYVDGHGVAALVAVHSDASGHGESIALAYAAALGCGRAGVLETTLRDETETDLFGEQAVLCGGTVALIRAAFNTLVEAGYPAELAYFECLHELKYIADLLQERGIAAMSQAISNTAEYGALVSGDRLLAKDTQARMREVLEDIRSGSFARAFMAEMEQGGKALKAARKEAEEEELEKVGSRLRRMMEE